MNEHKPQLSQASQLLSPDAMRRRLSKEIFSRWHQINGGAVERHANWLTLRSKNLIGLDYLLKGVAPTGEGLARTTHWYGVRQNHILKANSVPVSKTEVGDAFRFVFNRRTVAIRTHKPIERAKFTEDSIQIMKDYLETTGAAADWSTHKRIIVGKNVSDDGFLAYLNSGT